MSTESSETKAETDSSPVDGSSDRDGGTLACSRRSVLSLLGFAAIPAIAQEGRASSDVGYGEGEYGTSYGGAIGSDETEEGIRIAQISSH